MYSHLVVLHADVALYPPRVGGLDHLDLAGSLVVAEGAVEVGVERLDRLALLGGVALGLAAAHGGAGDGRGVGQDGGVVDDVLVEVATRLFCF